MKLIFFYVVGPPGVGKRGPQGPPGSQGKLSSNLKKLLGKFQFMFQDRKVRRADKGLKDCRVFLVYKDLMENKVIKAIEAKREKKVNKEM